MASMTHRERVLAALNHEETDRVPIDFGGTQASTIFYGAYDRLKRHLGLEHETRVFSAIRRLALPHESVLRRFDVDTRFLSVGGTYVARKVIDDDTCLDEWGITWQKAEDGNPMPVDGPFKSASMADLDTHDWPDPDDPVFTEGLLERAVWLRENTDCAIILNLGTGFGTHGQQMRGFADWMKDLYRNRAFATRLMDEINDHWITVVDNALDLLGDKVDIVFWGDDLSSQAGPLFSPEIYRELIKPRQKALVEAIRSRGEFKVLYHCCGSVTPFIDDLIEIGVDALNPVQVGANDMEPRRLKDSFGDRIAFWGGIDTQDVLPHASPEEVRAEVRRVIDCLARNGGYVLNSVHNIQPDVPPENIVAMFDEARTYRRA